mmetsp:Transcript_25337/g.28186  ORF Transcript_25337/g.28186 Transcript_25337/m.28186 type:complete len:96 (-) Transcript_25337:68-355(-)
MQKITIGEGEARIVSVTKEFVEYSDSKGKKHKIDLKACNKDWGDEYTVGTREALEDPPTVEFSEGPKFAFKNYDAIYSELLNDLSKQGWRTMDMC